MFLAVFRLWIRCRKWWRIAGLYWSQWWWGVAIAASCALSDIARRCAGGAYWFIPSHAGAEVWLLEVSSFLFLGAGFWKMLRVFRPDRPGLAQGGLEAALAMGIFVLMGSLLIR